MPDWAKASLARGATIFFPDGAPGDASAPKDALKAPRPYEFPLWKKPAQPDDAPTVATGGLSTGGTVATGGLSTGGAPPADDAAAAEVADDCSVGSERSAALSEAGSVSTVATALPVAPIAVDLATSGTYRPEPAADDARATAAVSPRAAQESEIPNFKGSDLGHFPLVSPDFWTSDHLSERSRRVDVFLVTRARGTLTLKRR